MLPLKKFLSVVVLSTYSTVINATCYSNDISSHQCRLPAGDLWCAENHTQNLYAYDTSCAENQGSSNTSDSSSSSGLSSEEAVAGAVVLGGLALLGAIFGGGSDSGSSSSSSSSSSYSPSNEPCYSGDTCFNIIERVSNTAHKIRCTKGSNTGNEVKICVDSDGDWSNDCIAGTYRWSSAETAANKFCNY